MSKKVSKKQFEEICKRINFVEDGRIDYGRVLNLMAVGIGALEDECKAMGCNLVADRRYEDWETIAHFLLEVGFYN